MQYPRDFAFTRQPLARAGAQAVTGDDDPRGRLEGIAKVGKTLVIEALAGHHR